MLPIRRILAPFLTFQLWTVSMVFFRADSLKGAWNIFMAIGEHGASRSWAPVYHEKTLWVLALSVALMEVAHWAQARGRIAALLYSKPIVLRWAVYYAAVLMILLYNNLHGPQEFIYFKF